MKHEELEKMREKRLAFSPYEIPEYIPISLSSVYRGIQKGEIPSKKLNGRILIPANWVFNYFNSTEEA